MSINEKNKTSIKARTPNGIPKGIVIGAVIHASIAAITKAINILTIIYLENPFIEFVRNTNPIPSHIANKRPPVVRFPITGILYVKAYNVKGADSNIISIIITMGA